MAAPAHFLSKQAENNAKKYALELFKALDERLRKLEDRK